MTLKFYRSTLIRTRRIFPNSLASVAQSCLPRRRCQESCITHDHPIRAQRTFNPPSYFTSHSHGAYNRPISSVSWSISKRYASSCCRHHRLFTLPSWSLPQTLTTFDYGLFLQQTFSLCRLMTQLEPGDCEGQATFTWIAGLAVGATKVREWALARGPPSIYLRLQDLLHSSPPPNARPTQLDFGDQFSRAPTLLRLPRWIGATLKTRSPPPSSTRPTSIWNPDWISRRRPFIRSTSPRSERLSCAINSVTLIRPI